MIISVVGNINGRKRSGYLKIHQPQGEANDAEVEAAVICEWQYVRQFATCKAQSCSWGQSTLDCC